jgi:small subunit ribosomal protein S7|uniref:ribosomal protein S7 n=1 Tax=Juncus roemerianus TaxID=879918 RepID=UPI00237B04BF|nr:ribosomal protein S7 [Juncus roemerianus]YP_010692367.1 ribosomal protein S7 [Juncus roemerianus]UZM11309.1 ribosomal protein S7 [Juncus roemerianus]UZM11329.1 ribosomal protein S7 [Juncus roemerianus]
MSRQDTTKKKSAKYDPICGSQFVNMLVNRMMKHGKKSLAYQIFYRAAIDIKRNTGKNPISVFREALFRVSPRLIVKTRKRKKGKTFKVPLAIPFEKGALLGIRWLLGASRQRSGTNMASQLSAELRDAAFKKRGNAIRKREQIHKMAEGSRTFAHFRSSQSKKNPVSAKFRYAAFKKRGNAIRKKEQTHKMPKHIKRFVNFHSPRSNRSIRNPLDKLYRRLRNAARRRRAARRKREREQTLKMAKASRTFSHFRSSRSKKNQ